MGPSFGEGDGVEVEETSAGGPVGPLSTGDDDIGRRVKGLGVTTVTLKRCHWKVASLRPFDSL